MMTMKDAAKALLPEVIHIRRELHMHPELSFQEKETTVFIRKQLQDYGVEVLDWKGETGVVGLLRGSQDGPCVALRADIDALPVLEATGCEYASKTEGKMHACGHDAHTAGLLGAAKILASQKKALKGTIKFIFQPAEELLTGAASMVKLGVLENPKVDFVFGMHNNPELPCGTIAISSGAVMAATASTTITVRGVGGHGAQPHKSKDPIVAAAAIIQALQTIVSRRMAPGEPAVITVGSIHGGQVGNIIPELVEMKGTVRLFSSEIYEQMEGWMREMIEDTAKVYGCSATFEYEKVVPCVFNPEKATEWCIAGPLEKIFGAANIVPCTRLTGGEDFARFQEKVPGIYCFYGSGNTAKGITAGWHNPGFNLDEDALAYATGAYAQVALDALEGNLAFLR